MASLVWVVTLLLLAVVVLLYQGAAIVLAYEMPRLDPTLPDGAPQPRVSVVIAARNEVEDLPATLDSLRAQDMEISEIVVVDGGSTDGTADVVRRAGAKVRLVSEPPLPTGWVGKS